MAQWFFEPGHTAAEFCVRHMMVTYVRGHFKNVHGRLNFDPAKPQSSSVEVEIDARGLWTGEPDRDAHLRSADFLDVEHHTTIAFRSREVKLLGDHDYSVPAAAAIFLALFGAGIAPRSFAQKSPVEWWRRCLP